ncbi:metal-sulfur cluster assembly factor [Loigolactobacillus backii]|uniref:metal-sulfur cluster assembly factor n=1 Tax=Loigolactobacillus backii TaxID=375175 RepID=UPI0022FD9983|nr:metal-sulfur cluster assembly factor [Loigolactobacillus backii]MDA5387774.1 metal-sulfur cluster assembly factor [Loigolactobacillus backii]MDA5390935.1 metal-sulfur cluster assembly factor [Loigolactobacillus backii]
MRDDIKINERAATISDQIIAKLQNIYDLEIGLDIYNLGLIYEIELDDAGSSRVVLTFTEMGCGCIDSVPNEIKAALVEIEEIKDVEVEIVWAPTWKMNRISRFGRISLGISPR